MIRLVVAVEGGRLELEKKQLRATMRSAGAEVAATARRLVRKAVGAGRLYRGPGGSAAAYRGGYKAGPHQASAPGQAPASITGTLANSIIVKPFKSGEGVAIRDTAFYAKFLEAGAVGGSGSGRAGVKGKRNKRGLPSSARVLLPRPFLSMALEQCEPSIALRVAAAINQGVKFQKAPKK